MFKSSLKKLITAALVAAMLTAAAPMAGAVTLSEPVALDKTVVVESANVGLSGVVSSTTSAALPSTTGDYTLSYTVEVVKPMAEFSVGMNISGKNGGFFKLNSYNAEDGTYNAVWSEKSENTIGKIKVGQEYTVTYKFINVGLGGEGKVPTLSSLTVTDADGSVVASGSSFGLRNFSDTGNGASKVGFGNADIAVTAISDEQKPEIKLGDFIQYTKTGADEVVVSIDGTELNETGNAAIELGAKGTADSPIMLDAVVKQAGEDVSDKYTVVYSLKENISGITLEDNALSVSGTVSGEVKPVVVVSLMDKKGEKAYDSFAEIELNINKETATAEGYLETYIADMFYLTKNDGTAVEKNGKVYDCGNSFDVNPGNDVVSIKWTCYMLDDDEWVECDAVDTETGKYTPQKNYYDEYKLVATITYKADTSVSEDVEFLCNFYDDKKEVAYDYDDLDIDDEVDDDIDLPTVGKYGSAITWASSNPSVISKEGDVTRKSSDKEVRLTATIEKGGESMEKYFTVTVLKKKTSGGGGGGGSSSGSISSSSIIGIKDIVTETPKPAAESLPVSTVTTPAPASAFTDLDSVEWAKTAITELANRRVVTGKTATTFAPNDEITRAEFVKILIGAFGLVNPNATVTTLTDVTDSSAWYYNAVASAYNRGIVSGYSDGSFGVNDKVTRQDMAVMILKAAQSTNTTINVLKPEANFADADKIADYAKEAVNTLQRAGVVNGLSETEFAPTATATRAQAAKMIYELIK